MATPTVSIITPAYNAARFIGDTIASVQAQSFQDWEMIIADDGSKDHTVQIVETVMKTDARVKLVRLGGNSGPAVARNASLAKATGRYIAFLDSDDLWFPQKLEAQLAFMREKDAALSFTQFRRFIDDPKRHGRLLPAPESVTYGRLLKHNVIATLTTMVDTEKTGPISMVNEGYDDFILWLSILKKGFVGHGLQQDLARYRIVSGSVSHKRGRAAKWVWTIFRKVERLSLPRALWAFANYAVRVSLKHRKF